MILQYFNFRTAIVLAISLLSCYLAIKFNFKIHFDIVVFGLAVAFPLGTSIQTAFKRRERALEFLSVFKAGFTAINYSLQSERDLSTEQKAEGRLLLIQATESIFKQLRNANGDNVQFQKSIDSIYQFVERNREFISGRIVIRIIRYLRDSMEASTFLLSLVRHRTMIGLRFYSLSFINVFAVIQAPMVVYELENQLPMWALYFTTGFSSLILITLYNFQQLIEYPFDEKGADDIDLDNFKLQI
jgi:hypothetical protein